MELSKKLWVNPVPLQENPTSLTLPQFRPKITTTKSKPKSKRVERKRRLLERSEKNEVVENYPTKKKAIELEVVSNKSLLDIGKKTEAKITSNGTKNYQLEETKLPSVPLTTKELSLSHKETKSSKPLSLNCLIHVRIAQSIARSIGKVRLRH
jgi:hypothetical protein